MARARPNTLWRLLVFNWHDNRDPEMLSQITDEQTEAWGNGNTELCGYGCSSVNSWGLPIWRCELGINIVSTFYSFCFILIICSFGQNEQIIFPVLIVFCQLSSCTWIYWFFLIISCSLTVSSQHPAGHLGHSLEGLPVRRLQFATAMLCRFKSLSFYLPTKTQKLDVGVNTC